MEADTLFLACPSKYLRALCQDVRNHLGEARQLKLIITLSKGLEEKTNKTPITSCEVYTRKFSLLIAC